ncbi:hypothetical protein SAMN05443246_5629 [Paenibacillus sp. GP183]|nr:hypothetical protein SAMN05443246_5629 [Paenibacillus sp. GP183]
MLPSITHSLSNQTNTPGQHYFYFSKRILNNVKNQIMICSVRYSTKNGQYYLLVCGKKKATDKNHNKTES